jgi:hypothetical protein
MACKMPYLNSVIYFLPDDTTRRKRILGASTFLLFVPRMKTFRADCARLEESALD